jgi:hypothetical protein
VLAGISAGSEQQLEELQQLDELLDEPQQLAGCCACTCLAAAA